MVASCLRFAPHPDGAVAILDCAVGKNDVVGSHVLLAVGRRPNNDDLGLENAGVEVNS